MKRFVKLRELQDRKDFLSVDGKTAISSEGTIFRIGDSVIHDDPKANLDGVDVVITDFMADTSKGEVRAITTSGYAHISFLDLR